MTIACPDCGTLEDIPLLPPRSTALCLRCKGALEKTSGRSESAALACSLATFLLLFPTNILPLIRVDIFGQHSANVIAGGVSLLFSHGWVLLAGLSALFVVALPFARFFLLSLVLASLRFGYRPGWLGTVFRWTHWLDPWAMLDVFLLASFIGYYRLINVSQAHVGIETGGICFIVAACLTMITRAALDRRTVWRAIGGERTIDWQEETISCTACDLVQPASQEGKKCPRCRARLQARFPDTLLRTEALLLAAFILFFPANIYPMNISTQLGKPQSYTIFTGIRDLFHAGLAPLGILIFCTSILIPVGKIFVIAWCVLSVRRGWTRHLVAKTHIFRLVAELGRWSKTDPFTIVFFVPLLNFSPFASSTAGWGAIAFMMMTVLTMVASVTFDPRLMWDAEAARRQ